MPAVSVIVPVYKAEPFLRKCTDSVLHQTLPDLELLLIDDGSPDGSGALCDAIAGEDGRVRVFHKENGGVSSARNLGLAQAKGHYIAFVDSDDWMEPEMLKTLYTALQSAQADSAGCAHLNVTPSGQNWPEAGVLPAGIYGPDEMMRGIVDPLLGDRVGTNVVNGFIWRFLFSADVLRSHSMSFEGAYLEDELFLMEYFCYAKKLVMVDQPLYCYLQNPSSVTHRYMKNYMDTFHRFMERKGELVERLGLESRRPQWRQNSNFAGLLIAIGNEYAAGNSAAAAEKREQVRQIASLPEMEEALRTVRPEGQSRNKQIVTALVRRRWFGLLTLLYRMKNRS
ncbi:glycosyltransferase [Oscillibacter hominis]|uniref:Glycosyltransferase n=1 Tax=Oscillibacter hominis TaxID=2763056 RepID=A0A7G9B6E8_9FIRM|nr:glycosyltransferase [Oscillibacter hominis]QNL45129.1 glycosyltransferase [Oscillibacter hominis]